jgi:hypothetical protein
MKTTDNGQKTKDKATGNLDFADLSFVLRPFCSSRWECQA